MPRDVFEIAALAEMMHAEGRYKSMPFDKKKIINGMLLQMANMVLVGFVDERNGKIIGMAIGFVDQYSFCEDYLLRDRCLFILPEYRKEKAAAKLLRAYIAAANKLGIKEIIVSTSYLEDPNALDLLYKKVGFDKVGYRMELQ
jgi:GNAT superfamily N-acetyltransferase